MTFTSSLGKMDVYSVLEDFTPGPAADAEIARSLCHAQTEIINNQAVMIQNHAKLGRVWVRCPAYCTNPALLAASPLWKRLEAYIYRTVGGKYVAWFTFNNRVCSTPQLSTEAETMAAVILFALRNKKSAVT